MYVLSQIKTNDFVSSTASQTEGRSIEHGSGPLTAELDWSNVVKVMRPEAEPHRLTPVPKKKL